MKYLSCHLPVSELFLYRFPQILFSCFALPARYNSWPSLKRMPFCIFASFDVRARARFLSLADDCCRQISNVRLCCCCCCCCPCNCARILPHTKKSFLRTQWIMPIITAKYRSDCSTENTIAQRVIASFGFIIEKLLQLIFSPGNDNSTIDGSGRKRKKKKEKKRTLAKLDW